MVSVDAECRVLIFDYLPECLIDLLTAENTAFVFSERNKFNIYRQHYNAFMMTLMSNLIYLVSHMDAYNVKAPVFNLLTALIDTAILMSPELTEHMQRMAEAMINALHYRVCSIRSGTLEPLEKESKFASLAENVIEHDTSQTSDWSNSSL